MSEGQTQALGVREPLPGSPLPGIEEKLRQLAAAQLSPTSEQDSQPLAARAPARAILKNGVNRRATLPASSVQVPSTQDRLIGQPRPSQQVNSHIVNPYIRRADAIGRRHHVPGIGHLGDLLTPPGWSPGNDPITTVEAQKLFQQARTRARTLLDLSIKQNKNLSEEEQQKRDVEEDQKWQAQLKLDQVVCSERQKLYENWQALKAQVLQAQQAGLQRQYRPENGPRQGAPQPHDLPTGTSAHAYTEYQQSQVNVFPHDYAPSRPLSAGSIHNRVQELQRSIYQREDSCSYADRGFRPPLPVAFTDKPKQP